MHRRRRDHPADVSPPPVQLLFGGCLSESPRRSLANSIAGQDPEDATSLPAAPPRLFVDGPGWSLSPLEEPLQKEGQSGRRPLRIGLDNVYNSEGVDPELTASVEAAAKLLAEAVGGEIVPVELPAGDELQSMINGTACAIMMQHLKQVAVTSHYLPVLISDHNVICNLRRVAFAGVVWGVLCAPEAVSAHTAAGTWPSRKELYGTWFRSWLEQGETVTGVQYAEARMIREQCVGKFESAFAAADIDVLACPAAIGPPHHDVRAHEPELLLSDISRPITTNPNGELSPVGNLDQVLWYALSGIQW